MDPKKFDEVIRQLSQRLSRRSAVGGALGASLLTAVGLGPEGGDDALAKGKKGRDQGGGKDNKGKDKGKGHGGGKDNQGKGKGHGNNGAGKENKGKGKKNAKDEAVPKCLPAGSPCPDRFKRRPAKRGHKAVFVTLTCDDCCGQVSINGMCACKANGQTCSNPGECCSGICTGGVCRSGPFVS